MECVFQNDLSQLLPDLEIELEYSPGFHTEQGLMQDLLNQHQKDIERRYTEYGPHRADLRLKTPFGHADVVLSRGQKTADYCFKTVTNCNVTCE